MNAQKAEVLSARALHDDEYVEDWLEGRRAQAGMTATPVSLSKLDRWRIDPSSGNISHDSGRFFSVIGLGVQLVTPDAEYEWDQPIFDQAETGMLGFLVNEIDGVLHYCVQGKAEPGNIGKVQLAPTVQATHSNCLLHHGGSSPLFVKEFLDCEEQRILLSSLQSEDGSRFISKSNRNMIVRADDSLFDLPDDFIWLTLAQILTLMRKDNTVNSCCRSVISTLLGQGFEDLQERSELIRWLDSERILNAISIKRKNIKSLKDWRFDKDGYISHIDGRFFRILGLRVNAPGREVSLWDQPIFENAGAGIIGLLITHIDGEIKVLLQSKPEAGNKNTMQIGATAQFTPGNHIDNDRLGRPFLFDEFISPDRFRLIAESRQTEDGGRFYNESHIHRILELPEGSSLDIPHNFRWFSLPEINFLLRMGEMVNSNARSIMAFLL